MSDEFSRSRSPRGDASLGLDPSADVEHHLEGRRWLPTMNDVTARLGGPGFASGHGHGHHHHHHHTHQHRNRTDRSRSGARTRDDDESDDDEEDHVYDGKDSISQQQQQQHSTPSPLPASSTSLQHDSEYNEKSIIPRGSDSPSSSSTSASSATAPTPSGSQRHPPTGSLSIALFSPGLSLSRRASLLGTSIFVNMLLPFVNGTMLGVGELVARGVLIPAAGIAWVAAVQYFRKRPA